MNKRKLLKAGAGAIGASALVFCVFKAYKYIKTEKKRKEDEEKELESILLKHEIERHEEIAKAQEQVRKESYNEWLEEITEEDEDAEQLALEWDAQRDMNDEEEVEKLRHDPNSEKALIQYQNMKMADIRNQVLRSKLKMMWGVQFTPDENNDADETVGMHMDDDREEFFGDSKWVGERTFAELILHFANLMNFDNDTPVEDAVEFMIINLDIRDTDTVGHVEHVMWAVANHTFYNGSTYGLFGNLEPQETFMQEYWTYMSAEMDIQEAFDEEEEEF